MEYTFQISFNVCSHFIIINCIYCFVKIHLQKDTYYLQDITLKCGHRNQQMKNYLADVNVCQLEAYNEINK